MCERLLVSQVDPGGRLVEEEQLRLPGQRPSDQHPLLLAAGELGDAVAGAVEESHHLEGVPYRCAVGGTERTQQAATGQTAGGDDLPHRGRDAGGGPAPLGHVAHAGPAVEALEVGVEEPQLSRGQRAQPDQGAHQGGLPGPVGPHQRDELTGLHPQVHVTKDGATADGDRPVLEVHGCYRHALASRRASRFASMRER